MRILHAVISITFALMVIIGRPAIADAQQTCQAMSANSQQQKNVDIIVDLDPATVWQPRGGNVRLSISSSTSITIKKVQACFHWVKPETVERVRADPIIESKAVEPLPNKEVDGKRYFSIAVPYLPPVPYNWPMRMHASQIPYEFEGLGTVPVAKMDVFLTIMADGAEKTLMTSIDVGISQVGTAIFYVIVATIIFIMILYITARYRNIQGDHFILKVISTSTGKASLSQLQIVLWTLVVAGCAVYVMALTGALLPISNGTLVLLGIAGTATIGGRLSPSGAVNPPQNQPADAPAAPAAAPTVVAATPQWTDLLISDTSAGQIDVTRFQLLIFTCIAAFFVALKVALTYQIPEIPEGFLLLMGISNGVYLTGRFIPPK